MRDGRAYLARLREAGPSLWLGNSRVGDVTAHPATAGAARTFARLYDLALEPANADVACVPSPAGGGPVSTQFLVPRSPEDLARRRRFHRLWADETCGLMGRTTDFVSAMLLAWYVNADYFGPLAPNVRSYFEHVRDNDLFLTHALIDPPVDRSKPASEQPDPFTCLGVVRECADGLVVRGAKMFATAAPFADEILCWPFAVKPQTPAEDRYAIAFAVATDSPGLSFIGREPYAGGDPFDEPLASRFDEMDAVAVFEDVLVPWKRVFIDRDHERVRRIWQVNSNAFTGVQTATRLLSKLQFMAGLAKRATDMLHTAENPHVRDAIGEITSYVELTRAAVLAAEAGARADQNGVLIPDVRPLFAIRNSGNRWYPRVREILQQTLSGSLMYQPASISALDSPLRPEIEKYYRGASTSAAERIKLFSVAADLAVRSFGGRHELYERLYAGDPQFLRIATQYLQYDWSEPLRLIDGLLRSYDVPSELRRDEDGAR